MPEATGAARLALRLLERRLPDEVAEAICGDLEHEYRRRLGVGQVRLRADAWLWWQALTVRAGALRRSAERLRRARPLDLGSRGAGRGGISWLDVKLGFRMLRKHPVMTLAALLALMVGIPASMVPGHVSEAVLSHLPEDPEGRVRSLRYWDDATSQPAAPTYFELARWREELGTFQQLAAFRATDYNLPSPGGDAAPASGAEVTGSVFEILRAVPLMGRTLDRADERPGAPEVVVIGEDLWRARLVGDPNVVGKTLRVGGVPRTIVGVMPRSFRFPSQQQLWLPLTEELLTEPARGRDLQVFGRLADGASAEEAEAEVAASGARLATEFPESNARLGAEVVRFGVSELRLPRGGWDALSDSTLLRILSLILLGVACGNVGMLVFARTATRLRELAIRTSLGASRRRIVSQMFVESLVLAVSAAGLGLAGYQVLAVRVRAMLLASTSIAFPPYWLDFGLTPRMVLGALGVGVLSACIAGVLPALKVTGKKVQESIQQARAGSTGMRFGGVTGALIVVDVAIAVAVVGLSIGTAGQVRDVLHAGERVGIPAEEYLAVELSLPSGEGVGGGGEVVGEARVARMAQTQRALTERLEAEPRVRGVAAADRLPRQDHHFRRFALEGETSWRTVEGRPGANAPPLLPVARVDVGYFDALGQPILAGRGFGQADLEDDVSSAIVNTSFVERRMGGRNPIGRRFRFWVGTSESGEFEERWYQIVGVVGTLGMNVAMPAQDGGVYLPAAPGDLQPLRLAVHVEGDPESFVPRLREIVSEVDPTAILQPPRRLDRVFQGTWYLYLSTIAVLAVVLSILVGLAASGVYAIMSFAVSRRTREIGIRAALGERRSAVAFRIGRRSLAQIALGAVLGVPPATWLYRLTDLGYQQAAPGAGFGVAFAGAVGVALVIGLLACLSPTRRALRIEPTEALRAEG